MRRVILHYHLFKNAGTSLDATFKENFEPGEWVTKEFSPHPELNREQVVEWIKANETAKCFSSHTAILQDFKLKETIIIPVIFIRHPIDRIASVYHFEKNQKSDSFGATLAKNTTMAGYIETRLAVPHDRQCRNFHTDRFAPMSAEFDGSELDRALMSADKLPFVGIVEQFATSLLRLEKVLVDIGFKGVKLDAMKKNVSRETNKSLDEKISEIEKQVGRVVFEKLIKENYDDLQFYNHLVKTASCQ